MHNVLAAGILNFGSIYDFFDGLLPESLDWLAYAIASGILALLVINAVILSVSLFTWFERRALGRIQSRLGPNRWGPFGLLQPFADVLKLMLKEDTVPETADRPVFNVAPIVLVAASLLVFAVIPLGHESFLGKLNIGVLFILAVTSVNTLAVFMAGWASRNKYAMFGAARGVAMLLSYEVPMGLAIVGVALAAGSLATSDIVKGQAIPFFLLQPLGFLVFVTAALAEMSRTPFDMIEAESELGAGYHTEYSGIKFAVLQLAEFGAPIAQAVVIVTLFLSGWRGFEPIPGWIWFLLKVVGVLSLLLWTRATWPRLRVDQIMEFAWKGLFPLALVNLFAVAIEIQVLQNDAGRITTQGYWVMAAVNWGVTLVAIVAVANLLGQRRLNKPDPVPSTLANMHAGSN